MKRGIVYISPELWNTQPEIRGIVAKEFKMIRFEQLEYEHWYRMLIEDDRLDEVNEGEAIPRYDILMKNIDDKPVFDKIEKQRY
jgi:hypothetical protein